MNAISLYSMAESQYVAEIDAHRRRQDKAASDPKPKGDTVSFSEEGKALAAEMTAYKAVVDESENSSAFERNPGGDAAQDEAGLGRETAKGAGGAGASGAPAATDAAAQIEKLQARIKQLSQQVSSIMSGAGSLEAKVTQSAPLEQQIQGLEQQVQELLAQEREQTKAA